MRGFILAAISLILTIASISLVTFALFIRTEDHNTSKVQAGELDIELYIQTIVGTEINNDANEDSYGKLINMTPINYVTGQAPNGLLLNTLTDSVFDVVEAVPTQKQTATFMIKNKGTIAATFEIQITDLVLNAENLTHDRIDVDAASEALSEQILITMTYVDDNGTPMKDENDVVIAKEFILSTAEGTPIPSLIIPTVKLGEDIYFTISWEFLDDRNNNAENGYTFVNNEAQKGAVQFDLTVIATQDTQ
jgi:hypothetical protein